MIQSIVLCAMFISLAGCGKEPDQYTVEVNEAPEVATDPLASPSPEPSVCECPKKGKKDKCCHDHE